MQKLIQSRLKEIFIVISAIIFKGKATHRFIRKRRKISEQSSAQSSSLYCHAQSSLEAAPNPQHEAVPVRSSPRGSGALMGTAPRSCRSSTRNPGIPRGEEHPAPTTGHRHSSGTNTSFLLPHLWAVLNPCSPRSSAGPRTQTLTHQTSKKPQNPR